MNVACRIGSSRSLISFVVAGIDTFSTLWHGRGMASIAK